MTAHDVLAAGPPQAPAIARSDSIDDVIDRMTELGKRFKREHGPDDGVLAFNKLYLAVTRGIKRAGAAKRPLFDDPVAITRLDVIFAQLYFDAVDAADRGGEPATWAWRVLFEHRARPGVLPIQFAVAGMNAHINHDLPIALLEQWELEGGRPDKHGPAYADFTQVNQVLRREEVKLKPSLEPADVRPLDTGLISKLDDRLGLWVIEEVRARAWSAADALWDVRHLAPARKAWLASADALVGAFSETLLTPL